MNSTRPHANARVSSGPSEKRAKTRSTWQSTSERPAAGVTVGRSAGVVQPSSGELAYEADPSGHRIVARYPDGRIAYAFGGYGHGAGQFHTPLHVAAVAPEFSGEAVPQDEEPLSLLTPWLAVADYGNRRVQFFECDGAYVGESDLAEGHPPCYLSWRAPVLEVTSIEGQAMRLHVAAALLSSGRGATRHRQRSRVHTDPRLGWRVC